MSLTHELVPDGNLQPTTESAAECPPLQRLREPADTSSRCSLFVRSLARSFAAYIELSSQSLFKYVLVCSKSYVLCPMSYVLCFMSLSLSLSCLLSYVLRMSDVRHHSELFRNLTTTTWRTFFRELIKSLPRACPGASKY